jgi:nucleotide-binding universal stress UspA family protein
VSTHEPMIDGAVYGRPDNWDEPVVIPPLESGIGCILVPFDGSTHGEAGLAHAVRMATWSGASFVAEDRTQHTPRFQRRSMLPAESIVSAMEADAKELATETVQLLLDRGLRARGIVVRGEPSDAILETVLAESADMVVIGRRSAGSVRSAVMGSVSERIIRYAEVPVLVVA